VARKSLTQRAPIQKTSAYNSITAFAALTTSSTVTPIENTKRTRSGGNLERTIEPLQEAARRANWDAQHGPQHLRIGRFFTSAVMETHAFTENDNATSESVQKPSDPAGTSAAELALLSQIFMGAWPTAPRGRNPDKA
jgi:hypothetical protein